MLSLTNVVTQSWISLALFAVALGLSVRRIEKKEFFSPALTNELKGLAIFAVIFVHIGYFLVDDHRFLFPLSIIGGVGVNLFLFLSGFGLTKSALQKPFDRLGFYVKRLPKLYIPLWITLAVFVALDFIIVNKTYSVSYLIQSALGFFPRADLWQDLNSPLWYFTLIVFYYLLFPLLFIKRAPWLSAVVLYVVSYAVVREQFTVLEPVYGLHRVHLLAFPLGIMYAWITEDTRIMTYVRQGKVALLSSLTNAFPRLHWYYGAIAALAIVVVYTAYYSAVGTSARAEELTSLVTMAALIMLFVLKRVEFRFLSLFGIYSYEIYLLHWPLLARYEVFYAALPASVATVLYLVLFLLLGWSLRSVTSFSRLSK